ncbi:MAG: hypothetical protein BWY36_00544 [Candidatus Diapherotrites archaeon ADurb.Bin253]|jgi:hypothetical protein|nr:MAG: hypothetical protein BWY36_00544 [Candidatus Diapherotrites archaeon ADurb.Bin253]HNZ51847.1 hypothetical protein [Candidatus Pacearchaeota archaeon]HOC97072.1 hypothetical protein [Candidatus Pacearchaeota archaeon]HOH04179.1 hypothetical protein [Candidatus Pacearchaeota archaeon]HPX74783.1 hypothetical protein [Candidatus Pacearchaeota archaeon]
MKQLKKAIIFDAGALITISMNGLDKEIRGLKSIFDGAFLITQQVKKEVIDKPLTIKSFELEALRTKKLLDDKVIELAETYGFDNKSIENKSDEIMNVANSLFMSPKEPVKLLHLGEASCFALSDLLNKKNIKNVIVIDERTARMLIEKPENLRELLIRKLHTNISLVKQNFAYFKNFQVIRSAELIYVAWKKDLVELKDGIFLLDALLYAVKSKGCAISSDEIEEIKKMKNF